MQDPSELLARYLEQKNELRSGATVSPAPEDIERLAALAMMIREQAAQAEVPDDAVERVRNRLTDLLD